MSTNASDAIAGLMAVTQRMLELPPGILSEDQVAYVSNVQKRVPPLPTYKEAVDGKERTFFSASEKDGGDVSSRNPGLFALFPFGVVYRDTDHFDWMSDTWKYKVEPERKQRYIGWQRMVIYAALLGRAEEAKAIISRKLEDAGRLPEEVKSKHNRFPTFWGPGYDWTPDHNWGGSGMIGLQDMLLQTPDSRIYLLPAWPKDWDVVFKLHAPKNTVVEGRFENGKLVNLKVTPKNREKDIVYSDGR